jgi:NAD/NADP transhydrogenase beta subunit
MMPEKNDNVIRLLAFFVLLIGTVGFPRVAFSMFQGLRDSINSKNWLDVLLSTIGLLFLLALSLGCFLGVISSLCDLFKKGQVCISSCDVPEPHVSAVKYSRDLKKDPTMTNQIRLKKAIAIFTVCLLGSLIAMLCLWSKSTAAAFSTPFPLLSIVLFLALGICINKLHSPSAIKGWFMISFGCLCFFGGAWLFLTTIMIKHDSNVQFMSLIFGSICFGGFIVAYHGIREILKTKKQDRQDADTNLDRGN